jgi:hypothetical protein
MKKICIGIPHTGLFFWNTLMALLQLRAPKDTQICYHLVGSCLVYDAREKIVEFAKQSKCDYVVMLDSDMVPPSDMIERMFAILENKEELDMVTGMAFKRTPPFQPCFYTKIGYNKETFQPTLESPIEWAKEAVLMEIAGAGLACAMIKMSLFDRMKRDLGYFYPLPNLGEDLTFCLKAKAEGKAKFVVDLTIDVGHCSTLPIYSEHFHACYEQHKAEGNAQAMFVDSGVSV